MKRIRIWLALAISLIISPYIAHQINATCCRENRKHIHRHVTNCTYSQKDLLRILSENKDRYCEHCKNKTCFYCGCPIAEHSAD